MSCACGHDHAARPAPRDDGGAPITLADPMVALFGRLVCADAAQMMTALALLPDHIRLSRAEPGCLRFDIWQDDDPLAWNLAELFVDAGAFADHQARTQASQWGRDSHGIGREFARRDLLPAIRPARAGEDAAIDALLRQAFEGEDEARLVRRLREDGDLAVSLVAAAAGAICGHLALSPISGDIPALALAPVAVAPGAQRRGIGAALIRAAIALAGDRPVVVLGEPAYYSRFGFRPARLASPYAGPYLQVIGDLPDNGTIRHAPAFARLGAATA